MDSNYVVMVNYGSEGWGIFGHSDDFQNAVKLREQAMALGNNEVMILKPVKFTITEVSDV